MKKDFLEWIVVLSTAILIPITVIKVHHKSKEEPTPIKISIPIVEKIPDPPKPFYITTVIPEYKNYTQIIEQLKIWNKETNITEIQSYGTSNKNKELVYFRVNAPGQNKKVVLITACIHGNEPLATGVIMGYIGTLLDGYNKDAMITDLLKSRDIYFVPVVCPDSFPNSRESDRVDPNRDFPGPEDQNHKSTKQVAELQKLFLKIRPNAVVSGHTFGRIILYPWGDSKQLCPNNDEYLKIVNEMATSAGYKKDRACNLYGHTIAGTEVDWYHRNGAFAVVIEYGTHQNIPSIEDIKKEFDRTIKAILIFIEKAPEVNVKENIFSLAA